MSQPAPPVPDERQAPASSTSAPGAGAPGPDAPDNDDVVARLLASYQAGPRTTHHLGGYELPQMSEVVACLAEVRGLLFPGFGTPAPAPGAGPEAVRAHVRGAVAALGARLHRQIYRGLHHRCQVQRGSAESDCAQCAEAAEHIVAAFLRDLPELRATLAADVEAAYDGDPAATGTDEIIFCYPGLYAITAYRVAHELIGRGASIIPRMITEHAHERTGIDIHPGAQIGRSFFIDHGTGIVVGETCQIGERVRIYQGVTLGALSLPKGKVHALQHKKRHPTIEDDVIIYANATILGGDTIIGRGAVIGGNCWVTRSVPPGARVTVDGTTQGPG
jgi:serine O-acetyltransferase